MTGFDIFDDDSWEQAKKEIGGVPESLKRCLCGKLVNTFEKKKRRFSGVVNYDEILCDDCRKTTAGLSRIVCLNCRRLVGFHVPKREKCGFEYKPEKTYHVDKCPWCTPGLASSVVLEYYRYCRDQGIPTKDDLDLVQEIEQKNLRIADQASRLRSEIGKQLRTDDETETTQD